jgi:hypothetical protein
MGEKLLFSDLYGSVLWGGFEGEWLIDVLNS